MTHYHKEREAHAEAQRQEDKKCVKVSTPKPEAWVKPEHLERIKHWNGVVDAKNITLYSRERQGTVPIITTTQAEAYADERVGEVLEDVLELFGGMPDKGSGLMWTVLTNQIRALIPKEPPCET